MPAADIIHDAVKNALIKDGWTITADPYVIKYKDAKLLADLGAERPLAAERAGRKIIVEIKSFLGPSPFHDFKLALGQYELYRRLLQLSAPDRKLFLAISDLVNVGIFGRESIQEIVEFLQLSLLVVDLSKEEIVQWIN